MDGYLGKLFYIDFFGGFHCFTQLIHKDLLAPGFLVLEWRGTARNGKEWQADKKPSQFAEDS